MARPANQVKPPSLSLIIWANIIKWQMVRGVQDSEIAALLKVKNLTDRKRNKFITAEEMDTICSYLASGSDNAYYGKGIVYRVVKTRKKSYYKQNQIDFTKFYQMVRCQPPDYQCEQIPVGVHRFKK